MGGFTFAQLPGGGFDARNIDPAPSFVVPPLDDYIVVATATEPKANNAGTGGYLQFDLQIQQGKGSGAQYAKVIVPYRLNIFHADEQTMQIAYKQLSAMCHVTGVLVPNAPADLLNRPFIATIGPQKDNPQYSNVFGVKDLQGNIPGKKGAAAVATSPVAPVQQPPAPAQPAWIPAPANAVMPAAQATPPWQAQPQQPQAPQAAAPPWGPPQSTFAPQAAPVQAQAPWAAPQAAQPQAAATPPWQPASAAPAAPAWPPR